MTILDLGSQPTRAELRRLFSEATVAIETSFWMPKSYVAYCHQADPVASKANLSLGRQLQASFENG